MNIFQQHERFEIEVLDLLQRSKLLNPLVFGGGTMLRLCHELKRYSVDLDFWFLKDVQEDDFFQLLQQSLQKHYEITDAHLKYYTLICEVRSSRSPKRLKIEVRRAHRDLDYQEKIAFSRFSTLQVLVKALTLEQSMQNKVAAFLDRAEIRDCFDIEFLLRRGVQLPALDKLALKKIEKKLQGFKPTDLKVKLGSIVEEDMRRYYIAHGMAYLQEKIQVLQSLNS